MSQPLDTETQEIITTSIGALIEESNIEILETELIHLDADADADADTEVNIQLKMLVNTKMYNDTTAVVTLNFKENETESGDGTLLSVDFSGSDVFTEDDGNEIIQRVITLFELMIKHQPQIEAQEAQIEQQPEVN